MGTSAKAIPVVGGTQGRECGVQAAALMRGDSTRRLTTPRNHKIGEGCHAGREYEELRDDEVVALALFGCRRTETLMVAGMRMAPLGRNPKRRRRTE